MPEYERTRPRSAGERLYRAMLHLYPRSFREEFGDAMIEFFRDRMSRTRGIARFVSVLRAITDLLQNAASTRVDELKAALVRRRNQRKASINAPSLIPQRREDHMWSSILQDLRFAARGIRRSPGFAFTVFVILAIGIGSSVAVFSVVNGVLLKSLPYPEPDRVVKLEHVQPFQTVSEPEFVDYRNGMTSLKYLAAYRVAPVTLAATDADPERLNAGIVSEEFFSALGSRMWLGRSFSAEENRRGGPFAVVLSHAFWTRRFGSDSTIIGKQLMLNERGRTVVGVMPPGVSFPNPDVSLWTPMRLNYDTLWERNNHYIELIGRLAPGASVDRAAREAADLATRFVRDYPAMYDPAKPLVATVKPLANVLVAESRPYLVTLFVAVTLVLMIACVNVANLMLARGEGRRRDIAIRTAMGASRYRVIRQALTESLVLALLGGTAGIVVATITVSAVRTFIPPSVPRASEIGVDPVVLLFALGVTIATGLFCGVVPAFRVARDDASDTLKEGGRSAGAAHTRGRIRQALVVSEIALAVVTLTGAGLMMRSLWHMQGIDLGFDPRNVLAVQISPPSRYADQLAARLHDRIMDRVGALPGVTAVAAVEELPFGGGFSSWSINIDGGPLQSVAEAPAAMPQKVSPGYFELMRVPVIRGRTFSATDRADAPLVAVVNETMARRMWPGKDAIGGTVRMLNPSMPQATVVGVVKDVRSSGFLTDPPATMYFSVAQAGRAAYYVPSQIWLLMRTSGDPGNIAASVRSIIREIEPSTPVARLQTMEDAIAASVAPRRFTSLLLVGFAGVALVLAGFGIYSVIAYSVSQRRTEMGIRMALGASRGRVTGQVLGEGIRTGVLGAALGIATALATTGFLRSMVVGVSPMDPLTLVSVAIALLMVALLASYLPARRASGIDPVRAIRAD